MVTDTNVGPDWVVLRVVDLNGDGDDDILWRHDNSGALAYWLLNADSTLAETGSLIDALDAQWALRGIGRIDGDNMADLIWRNTQTGHVAYWLLDTDLTIKSSGHVSETSIPAYWNIVAVTDLNDDEAVDLLWRNTATGGVYYWRLNTDGSHATSGKIGADIAANWTIQGVVNIDDNNGADLIWRDSSTGKVAYWLLELNGELASSGYVYDANISSAWQIAGLADLDADGRDDIIWRENGGGYGLYYWLLSDSGARESTGTILANVGAAWTVAGVND